MTAQELDGAGEAGSSRSVVDRALAILGTFQGGRVRQSLSELSRRSGIPVATAYRIVRRLSDWGALERDDDGRYRIGLRLWEVASLAPRSMGLQRVARPYMQDLYETTHCSVQLAIREGSELVSIERFQHPRQARHRPRVGGRYALHATAIGLVLLAHAPEDVRQEVLAGELRRYTRHTCVDPAELVRVLADVRQRGYALADRTVDLDYVSVAAPVVGPDGSVVAALSLVVKHAEGSAPLLVHPVRVTAMAIGRALRDPGLLTPDVWS
ncbi:IclR family transcriptional regulator [Geodermatophilus sabuli]|uniref:Glycerol operon regulatory protein n=1 Tax=Geodermatophilus sabuli TaxID=1564158 RepID=A0A285EIA1_9ACTN|nr:IclR family transcriptional regulator [Geodermatophilus sabuli]MBB3082925.1 DNA-binding IclR family transcriptional regulator [Geodermatophilus sabuli]SNX97924.1 transcriptional regulator, IclR family [Geodermatophilus sabuli]